jgi:hypothetical protein
MYLLKGWCLMKQIIAYQCEWCKKLAKSKNTIRQHEKRCYSNPDVKSCNHCDNQIIIDGEYFCSEFAKYIHEKPYFIDCEFKSICGIGRYVPFTCKKFVEEIIEFEEEGGI